MRIALSLGAIYFVWGSTFLAIRVAVATIPPFLMAAARWLVAGAILYSWARLRGGTSPDRSHWVSALWIGALMITFSNGFVTWAETRIPSGLAALLVASVSLWMVLLDWLRPGGTRPDAAVLFGLVLGFSGVALLTVPGRLAGEHLDRTGVLVLLLAAISWSVGSLYSPRAHLPQNPLLAVGMEMLAGGGLLLLIGLARGEAAGLHPSRVTPASLCGLLYLVVFGSLVGFTLFIWLMKAASPALISTYACVNPLVAVFLGWIFLGEPLGARTLGATAIIVSAVGFIVSTRLNRGNPRAAHALRASVHASLGRAERS